MVMVRIYGASCLHRGCTCDSSDGTH